MKRYVSEEEELQREIRRDQQKESRLIMLIGFLGGLIFIGLVAVLFTIWALCVGFRLV